MPDQKTVRVGAVQMICRDNDPDANVAAALAYCDRAARRGVEILCFPECATTGFDWLKQPDGPSRVHAEPVPGPTVERFAAKARQIGVYIIMGIVERVDGGLCNTAFVVGPEEGYMGRQRKVLAEAVFVPGTEANVFDTAPARIGIFICADMRSPELSRLLVLKGAQVLFQPTAYFHADGGDIRRRYMGKCCAQRARAMENVVHVVAANIGRPEYVNNSRIIAPEQQGPEVALARATRREQLLVADVTFDPDANPVRDVMARSPELFAEYARQLQESG
ncbi:MAG: hypothetical protein CMJ18_27595 [Phycisphaeraceae bacterium]|nr:hypothetical protein [Phycisphaeraceae bacterium]